MSSAGRLATVAVLAVTLLSACGSGAASDPSGPGNPAPGTRLCLVIETEGASGSLPTPTGCPTSRAASTTPVPTASTTEAPPTHTTPPPQGHFPYAWAASDDDPIVIGATFTLVRGVSPRRALKILVPDPKTPIESATRARAWADRNQTSDYTHYPQLVEAGARHGWTMILEDNGFRATDRNVLRRLTRTGAAVVVYNNVNFLASFQYAVHGRVLRDFDPLLYADYAPTGKRLPQESGIPFGHGEGAQFVSQSLQLAARLVGFRIVPADLAPARYGVAVGTLN